MVRETHAPWNWYQNPTYCLIYLACVPNFQKQEFTVTVAFGFIDEHLSDGEFLFPLKLKSVPSKLPSCPAREGETHLCSFLAVPRDSPFSLCQWSHTLTCIGILWGACSDIVCWAPSQVSDSIGLGQDLGICIFNKFPGVVAAAGLGATP